VADDGDDDIGTAFGCPPAGIPPPLLLAGEPAAAETW
jgi:hypothetical protein